jgi:hypothetical protein
MTNHVSATTGCLLVGEYVDEAECPANLAFHRGEVVRPQVVANFLDLWGRDDGMREFTVLLKDGRVVVVRGHGLKSGLPPNASVFSVVVRSGADEVIVALFKSDDVSGIFHGELRPDRKIA